MCKNFDYFKGARNNSDIIDRIHNYVMQEISLTSSPNKVKRLPVNATYVTLEKQSV